MASTFLLQKILILLIVWSPCPSTSFHTSGWITQKQHRCLQKDSWFVLESQQVSTVESDRQQQGEETTAPSKGALSMSVDELAEVLGGKGRALLAWDCYSIGIDPAIFFGDPTFENADEIRSLLPTQRRTQTLGKDALSKLSSLYKNNGGQVEGGVASLSHISRASDDTTKLLLKLQDGLEVETVIIPWNGVRSTLCISSQVGCRQGCTFCATGRMGRLRSLSSDEILSQMFFARKICRLENLPEITNIVFMGMGEPADNAENVIQACKILTSRESFQLSASKVTVSTVAPDPSVFSKLSEASCVLAWSVHAARDDLRKRLVPTTKYTMDELRAGLIQALLDRPANFKRTAMIEVALMSNVNDSLQEADELADFCRPIIEQVPGSKLIVNLIPFNDIGQEVYKKPTNEAVESFQQRLWHQGIYAHVRATRGDDESAACGQLATKKKKNQ
mmetsp:Transcript_3876/g.5600  ORF Transcript_3876/g.5600 Transcript_3876/m.5600 type:complete len:449 (-) Transcript_3876:75-1421(-)